MALTLDESDPCGTVASLRSIYANIVAGLARQEVSFRAGPNGVERRVVYGKADAGALLRLIGDYEAKCKLTQGGRPRRFGLRAGGRM